MADELGDELRERAVAQEIACNYMPELDLISIDQIDNQKTWRGL